MRMSLCFAVFVCCVVIIRSVPIRRVARVDQSAKIAEDEKDVSIVMADQRDVLVQDPETVQLQDLSFIDLSILLNYRYAKKHGYHFAYYGMPRENTCNHSVQGNRHPSWCKLVSLVHAQKQHPNIRYRAYLDSDMYIHQQDVNIDEMLQAALPEVPSPEKPNICEAHPSEKPQCTICSGSDCQHHIQQGDAWLATNNCGGILGAFVLLRGGKPGDDVLKKIWNPPQEYATFNVQFPWEQMAWNVLYEKSLKSDRRIVGITGMNASWTGHPTPERCAGSGLVVEDWSSHECHFDDDLPLWNNRGDRDARNRIRNTFGCGEGWNTTQKADDHRFYDGEWKSKLEHHNLYVGARKINYLNAFRQRVDESEFRELFVGARASKITLTPDDMMRLGAEIETPQDPYSSQLNENVAVDTSGLYEAALGRHFAHMSRDEADPIQRGTWEAQYWCDGPDSQS